MQRLIQPVSSGGGGGGVQKAPNTVKRVHEFSRGLVLVLYRKFESEIGKLMLPSINRNFMH